MNITKLDRKSLEIGDSCLLQVTVEAKEENSWVQFRTTGNNPAFVLADFEDATFYAISPENGTKNTEPPPKYDPNRKFCKGDHVRIITHRGRIAYDDGNEYEPSDTVFIVEDDELKTGTVYIYEQTGCACDAFGIHFSFLELITPVEELKRYIIIHNDFHQFYDVCWKDDDTPDGRTGRSLCRATYWYLYPPQTYTQKEAKEAAEAECARLNAEYRKEIAK